MAEAGSGSHILCTEFIRKLVVTIAECFSVYNTELCHWLEYILLEHKLLTCFGCMSWHDIKPFITGGENECIGV